MRQTIANIIVLLSLTIILFPIILGAISSVEAQRREHFYRMRREHLQSLARDRKQRAARIARQRELRAKQSALAGPDNAD